jgi:exodeoxyribonuclease-5
VAWANDLDPLADPFFVLAAPAGCGKTFCVRHLIKRIRGRMVFCAPTNKATKVLRTSIAAPDYKPDCRTIYSLLGLSLSADGEVKELTEPEDPIDLSEYRLVVVDEGSMLNSVVMKHLRRTAEDFQLRVLFLGDPAQLPPVKEQISPIWKFPQVTHLTKVMRHDNQILALATHLRGLVDNPFARPVLAANNAEGEGVWLSEGAAFAQLIAQAAAAGDFSRPDHSKVIAWRNVTVDQFNRVIRSRIFPDAWHERPWLEGDRVLFSAPAEDLEDKPIAKTDDEGTVQKVAAAFHPLYTGYKTFELSLTMDDNSTVLAHVLHPDSQRDYERRCAELAEAARAERRKWRLFWEFKEAFHQLKYGYAITAHRSQGSTYETAFVNYRDILINKDRGEALRCLYVACTRPKKRLILG